MLASAITPEESAWMMNGLGAVTFLLLSAASCTALMRNIKELRRAEPSTPQPFVIKPEQEYVERRAFDDLQHNLQELVATGRERDKRREERELQLNEKLDEHWRVLSHERSVSTARLHDRLEAVDKAMRIEVEQKFKEVRQEITELPSRLITLLRDTGAIGIKDRP